MFLSFPLSFAVDLPGFELGMTPFRRLQNCGTAKKPVHNLPVMRCAFVGNDTMASASGDRTINFAPEHILSEADQSCDAGTCCGCSLLTFFMFLVVFLLLVAGVVGACLYSDTLSWEDIEHLEKHVLSITQKRAQEVKQMVDGFRYGDYGGKAEL